MLPSAGRAVTPFACAENQASAFWGFVPWQNHLQQPPTLPAPTPGGSGGTRPVPGSATSWRGSPEHGGLCLQRLPAALGLGKRGRRGRDPLPGGGHSPSGGGSGRPRGRAGGGPPRRPAPSHCAWALPAGWPCCSPSRQPGGGPGSAAMAVAVGRPAVGAGRGFGVWGGPGGLAAGSPLPACAPAPRPAPNFLGPRLFGAAGSRAAPGGAALGGSPGKGERGRGGSGTPRYGGCGDTRGSRPPARLGGEGRLAVLHPCREGQRVSPLQRGGKKIEDPLHTHAEATRCCCGWGKVCVLHPAAETWRELRGELRLGGRGRETERSGSPLTFPALGSKAEVVPEPETRLWLLAEQMVCLQGGTGTRRVLVGLMMCLWGCPATGLL